MSEFYPITITQRELLRREGVSAPLVQLLPEAVKLSKLLFCPVSGEKIETGYLIDGTGYVSKDVATVILIHALVERLDRLDECLDKHLKPEADGDKEIESASPVEVPRPSIRFNTEAIKAALPGGEKVAPETPFNFATADGNKPGTVVTLGADRPKVHVLDLPAGTVLKFNLPKQAEIDRTPKPSGFDLHQVPLLDRALVRQEGDPEVGPAAMRASKVAVVERPDFDVNTRSTPVFEGYEGGRFVFGSSEDVYRYEREVGGVDVMEAVEAEFQNGDVEEFGEAITEEDQSRKTVKREQGRASISLPDRCSGAPAPKKF